jgi:hypothetical protein
MPLAAVAMGAVLASPAVARDGPHSWNTMNDGAIVQFGAPDTDERAIRLDCAGKGLIGVMGPADTDLEEGARIAVTLKGRTDAKRYVGEVVGMGDGPNFSVKVAPGDDAVTTLLAGRNLTLIVGKDEWSVPGKGAAKVLKPLLAICAKQG